MYIGDEPCLHSPSPAADSPDTSPSLMSGRLLRMLTVVGDPLDVAAACLYDTSEVLPAGPALLPVTGHLPVCSARHRSVYPAGDFASAQALVYAR